MSFRFSRNLFLVSFVVCCTLLHFVSLQAQIQSLKGRVTVAGGENSALVTIRVGLDGLPKSDVLKYLLADNCSLVVRPSGTEPKLKLYVSVTGADMSEAEKLEAVVLMRSF